ncbi:hypothetical protein CALCODRAFT_488164 [Calocera cornea HHB12733]|uniref:Uncharacterized protein n=1 Tax=Calocera cornea HHB12733 TaxID=1353952 RepID=A0A165CP42_9BASI|nr:hypothetical protein CALCODRAFT_488164 [Calocera cornea HHB12733]
MASPDIQYSCAIISGLAYQPECCTTFVYNPDGSFSWTGCTTVGSKGQPFTCPDNAQPLCQNPPYLPFDAETTHSYSCPTAPYITIACCDPLNMNSCFDPLFLNTPPEGPNTQNAFFCPNAEDNGARSPNCCTDTTYTKCANTAHQN